MIAESAVAIGAALNPTTTERKTRMHKPAKTVGKRMAQSFTELPEDGIAVAGLLVGNAAANIFRAQVVNRLPIGNIPASIIDVVAQTFGTAALVSAIPGSFGVNARLGVRYNALSAFGRGLIPATFPNAKAIFGVDEFQITGNGGEQSQADADLEAMANAQASEAANAGGRVQPFGRVSPYGATG